MCSEDGAVHYQTINFKTLRDLDTQESFAFVLLLDGVHWLLIDSLVWNFPYDLDEYRSMDERN